MIKLIQIVEVIEALNLTRTNIGKSQPLVTTAGTGNLNSHHGLKSVPISNIKTLNIIKHTAFRLEIRVSAVLLHHVLLVMLKYFCVAYTGTVMTETYDSNDKT